MPALLPFLLALGLSTRAWAADIDRFPLEATISVPEGAERGVQRIPVPLDLRSQADPALATDLYLVGPDDRAVPYAVARGESTPESVSLPIWPLDADLPAYEVRELDRPIDGLFVRTGTTPSIAEVRVEVNEGGQWKPHGLPQRVWRHELGDHTRVDLPASNGPFRVLVRPVVGDWRPYSNDIAGFQVHDASVPMVRVTLPVTAIVIEEDGWTRYVLPLPHRLPLREVTVHAKGDVFRREVALRSEARAPYGDTPTHGYLQRVAIGGARVDYTTLTVPGDFRGETLLLYVRDEGNLPLEIDEITVGIEGLELLARDVGPGPLRLFGGAEAEAGEHYDLNVAIPELRRLAERNLTAAPATANPLWQAPEARAALAGPGAEVDTRAYRWRMPVLGSPGLVRIAVGHELLARAQPDNSDLRLLTADGRQVPFLVRRSPEPEDWGALEVERTEAGGVSTLRIQVPHPELPIEQIELQTEAPVFQRRLTLSRVDGPSLEPLRTLDWVGADRPLRASVRIDQVVGNELILTIENGDDAPLPLSSVRASGAAWELIAVLPDAPVWLYGGSKGAAPAYDLSLLADSVERRASAAATLGPAEVLTPPPPTALDRALLFGGIGLLLAGLGVLTVRLLRAVPSEDEGPALADEAVAAE